MPPSITLSALSFSTPDGRALFSDLNLSFGRHRTGLIGRNGTGKTTLLDLIAGTRPLQSGAIAVTGTVARLQQTVQTDPDETVADLFGARTALAVLNEAIAGRASAEAMAEIDWMLDTRIAEALAGIGLAAAPDTRLAALSGGQQTRARLAALLFAAPDFLLLDEPTNHLDAAGRQAVNDVLANWRGGAIIVSHDRALLDRMDAIVELTSLGATRYGGNYSHYRERKALELAAAQHSLTTAEARLAALDQQAQAVAERKARRDGAGERKAARGGLPRILIGGRINRSEATSGNNTRIAERRRTQAQDDADAARQNIEIRQLLSVTLPPTGLPASRTVLTVDDLTGGHDMDAPILRGLSFSIVGPERVAIQGANGSGKTTLLSLLTQQLQPIAGSVTLHAIYVLLDQQVSLLDPGASIRDNFRRINPHAGENACRAALARFMFRADAALQSVATLSGGQLLRAGLACTLGGPVPPSLLILDEPTNHLDIDSIEAVEAGLRAYDGALLVVSHDTAFLDAIGITRRIELTPPRPTAGQA